ncbi:MAG: methyltransferase [Balneolaceae bacterium]
MSTIDFIKNFIKDRDVASITPTSDRCVKKVCTHIDFSRDLLIVEYGPGDGVFSRYLLEQMSPGSRLVMVEANENFVDLLRETISDPRATVHHALAGDVVDLLDNGDSGRVDYVLSGIPFSFLDRERKLEVLRATRTILKEGGRFLAYQTSGHLKKPVMEVFGNLSTEMEVLNIPPYLIYDVVKRGEE